MNREKIIEVNNTINFIYSLKEKMTQKIINGEIREDSDKKQLDEIKIKSIQALTVLLDFCMDEVHDPENTSTSVVIKIRYKLSKNLNLQDPRSITNSFLNQLIPTLAELSTYICARTSSSCVSKPQYFPSEQTKSFSDKNDISSINAELETLKNLLELFTTTFTPNNVGFYLKPKLYKDMDKTKTKMVFAELTRLTKMEKFNVDDTTNAPRQRAISFLNQLKNILRKANRKYGGIIHIQKPSVDKKSDISSKNISSHKKIPTDISSVEKISPKPSSINDVLMDFSSKKKKKYGKHIPIVVDHSLMPKKDKTIEQCFKEADQDFAAGGPKFLLRAKERYLYILKVFPESGQTEYILKQIAIIDKQIDVIITPPTATSSDSEDTTIKKTPPQGKINFKMGTIEDDFFRI